MKGRGTSYPIVATVILMIAACGGGGGGSSSPTAPPGPTPVTFNKTCQNASIESWCIAVTSISPASGSSVYYSAGQSVKIAYEYTSPWDGWAMAELVREDGTILYADLLSWGDMYPSSNCKEGEGGCATTGLGRMGESFITVGVDEPMTTVRLLVRLHDGPGDPSYMTRPELLAATKDVHRIDYEIHWMPQ